MKIKGPPAKSVKPTNVVKKTWNVRAVEWRNKSLLDFEINACEKWVTAVRHKKLPSIGPNGDGSCRGWPYLYSETMALPVISRVNTSKDQVTFEMVDCNLRGLLDRLTFAITFIDPDAARDTVLVTPAPNQTDRLQISWRPPASGTYIVEARLLYLDDTCSGGGTCGERKGPNKCLYLGAFQQRTTTFYSVQCDQLSLLPVPRIHVNISQSPEATNQQQCRDGETGEGHWTPWPDQFSGNASTFMFGNSKPISGNIPYLLKGTTSDMQRVNGPRKDHWFFQKPTCAYHYFSPQEALNCLSGRANATREVSPIILFVGDSLVRNLNIAFLRALGNKDADDAVLKQKSYAGGFSQFDDVRIGYVFMWNHGGFASKAIPAMRHDWLKQIKAHHKVVVVANFGAVHQLSEVCSGTYEKHIRADINAVRTLVAPAKLRLILVAPSLTTGLRDPNVAASRALQASIAMRNVLRGFDDDDADILDFTSISKHRMDDTVDGVHYYGSALQVEALVLLNLLCERPPL